jgi:hypothetical protein
MTIFDSQPNRHYRGARLLALAACVFLFCGTAPRVEGQERQYTHFRLPLTREMGELYPFDLTGDGRSELLVVELDRTARDARPYLTVFGLRGERFERIEGASAPLPPDLAMVGAGRFPFGPGLVLLTPEGLEVRPWREGRFRGEQSSLLRVESMFVKRGGELKAGVEWIVDLDGDGFHEIVVPRLDGCEEVRLTGEGAPRRHALLRTRSASRLWFYLRERFVAYQLPVIRFLDTDGAGWKDLVAFQEGLVQVFHLSAAAQGTREADLEFDLQPPHPFDPKKPWDPPLKLVRAEDLNGDGQLDLVFTKFAATDSALNTNTRVLIYYGRNEGQPGALRLSHKPDQVFASQGFSHPILADLNRDGRTDLALVNVEIGFWNAVKALIARTVTAETAFYVMPEGGRYPQDPTDVVDYSVKFSLGRFAHRPISTFADLNGDGHPDLLLSADKDGLGIHWGRAGSFWDGSHDVLLEDFLPTKPARVRVADLDGDGRDDLIFLYNRNDIRQMPEVNHRFTVLLSRFGKPEPKETAGSP